MIKKFIFYNINFYILSSFSYMELNFGVGNKSLDLREVKPHEEIFLYLIKDILIKRFYGVSYSHLN